MSRADKLAQFEVDGVEEFRPRWNVAPSQHVATIRLDDGKRLLSPMRWGLVPHWANDLIIGYKLINARSETVCGSNLDTPAPPRTLVHMAALASLILLAAQTTGDVFQFLSDASRG